MKFAQVLRDAIEEDNGLILRIAAFEQMVGSREQATGWSRRLLAVLIERSRKIVGMQRLMGALKRRSRTCH